MLNLVHPCIFGANPVNGEGPIIAEVQVDDEIETEFKKAQEEDERKNFAAKKIDPSKTQKVKEEIEAEGQSIVDESNMTISADKRSGKGSLKVRF